MADITKANEIQEKIRQALENLGDALDQWLNKRRRATQPVPIPIDQPYRRRRQ
jgi:DNA topoisomerase VI subunit B